MDPFETSFFEFFDEIIQNVSIDDLVLIVYRSSRDQILLIYNHDALPKIEKLRLCNGRSINLIYDQLENFSETDIIDSSGIVGYSDLQAIYSWLPIHAPFFREINDFLITPDKISIQSRGQVFQSMFNLANYMFHFWKGLPEDEKVLLKKLLFPKLYLLCLPQITSVINLNKIVAIIPPRLEEVFNKNETSCQLIYVEDLEKLMMNTFVNDWIISIHPDQIPGLGDNFHFGHSFWIDIKTFLGKIGAKHILRETLRLLAFQFYEKWLSAKQESDLKSAYIIETEARLMQDNVSNLVAIIPSEKFEEYHRTGEAIRIRRSHTYRSPNTNEKGLNYNLGSYLDETSFPEGFQSYPISFPILAGVLVHVTPRQIIDLSTVLWNSGRIRECIQTLWLFSQDALERNDPEWNQINPDLEYINLMAQRAATIMGLVDSWKWGGTEYYEEYITKIYRLLNESFLIEAKVSDDPIKSIYLDILKEWYSCLNNPLIEKSLMNIVQQSQPLLEKSEDSMPSQLYSVVENLVLVSQQLMGWKSIQQINQDENSDIEQIMSEFLINTLTGNAFLDIPSPLFRCFYQHYLLLTNRWHRIEEQISSGIRPSAETINELLSKYDQLKFKMFTPAHEQSILLWACQKDVEEIKRLQQASEQSPYLQLALKTPFVMEGVQEKLQFEVKNLGGWTASLIELELIRSNEYTLISQAVQRVDDLLPGQKRIGASWEILPKSLHVTLKVQVSFQDQKSRKVSQSIEEVKLKVERKPVRINKPTGNPYKPGKLVFGAGFFGRQTEMLKVIERVLNETNTIIVSPRRSGKTCLLMELREVLTNPEEMKRYELSAEKVAKLSSYKVIFTSIQDISTADPHPAATFFGFLYKKVCELLYSKYDEENIINEFTQDPVHTFQKYIGRIFSQFSKMHLVMLIDEWDELYREEFGNLSANLRSVIQYEPRITWIFSSTWVTIKEISEAGSPMHNLPVTLSIGPMDDRDARSLVIDPSAASGVTWHGTAVLDAIEQTGYRPHLIQLVCYKIIEKLSSLNTEKEAANIVTPLLVNSILGEIVDEAESTDWYFGHIWKYPEQNQEEEKLNWTGLLVLWCLASPVTELKPKSLSLSLDEFEDKIRESFLDEGLSLPDDVYGFRDELADEIKKLYLGYGTIREEKRVKRPQNTSDNSNSTDELLFHDFSDFEKVYSISVPITERWLKRIIPSKKEFLPKAYQGLLDDLEKRKQKYERREQRLIKVRQGNIVKVKK